MKDIITYMKYDLYDLQYVLHLCYSHCIFHIATCCDYVSENIHFLKDACFRYFQLGGKCVSGPVALLSV